LYGLLIVNKRRCVYSNIDPKVSRELFVRTALVEQELGLNEGFLAFNRELIEDIQVLENKSRRRDILVDEQTLFEFYDKKIPKEINNRAAFLKWYKTQKQQNKHYLHMTREELMQHGASNITEFDYPDTWQQDNIILPLAYHFDPGQAVDGVAVQIPVALLNQVQESGFDWHIPAFRHELISGLIKSLPKSLRRNFVPAPNYADAVLAAIEPMQGSLIDALTTRLLRMTGVRVDPEAWDLSALAPHLRLQFEVRDEHDKLLARGLDLAKLKAELQGEVTETLSKVADKGIEKSDLTQWDFGELPASYVKKQGQYEIKAYPALVDKKSAAAVELFDSEAKAQQAHQQGLRRLVLLNVPSPIKYLQQNLPNKAKLGLYFNPFGKIADLIDDCIAAGVDSLLVKHGDIRDEKAFETVKEQIRGELGDAVVSIATQVEQVLSIAHALHKKMKGRVDLTMITAHGDIKSQLESLIFKGFVSAHGADKIADLIRYLKAIQKRLEKLPVDPNRDRLCVLELDKVAQEYKKVVNKTPKGLPIPQEVTAIFWMQQELRVSLFAQTLGTPYPISAKRVLNAIKEIE
ncbi:MAG: ATP-dependent helicase HrpA, partial [Gammaproteobacteria bacterium]